MSTETELAQALIARIVATVEPVTRYDRSNMQFSDAVTRTVAGTGSWRQEVSFGQHAEAHAGRLPANFRNEGSTAQLNAAIAGVQERCEAELPDRLRAWMDEHAQTFTVLETKHVFDGPFVRGYEHDCGTCRGSGRVQCHGCGGQGTRQCTNCGGTSRASCFSCSGSGRKQCGQCGGRGQWTEQKSRQQYNSSTNSYYTEYYTEYHRCWSCSGGGQQNCSNCYGSGKVNCLQCNNGRVTCGTCSGQGQLTCSSCGGVGRQHTLRTLTCKVGFDFTSQVIDDREEVRATVARLNMKQLHGVAPLHFKRAETGRAHALREYTFQLPTVSVRAGVGEAARTIIGYGAKAEVFDMKGLVSVLLMGDLEELERSLKGGAGAQALDTALDLAFLSEAHIAIAKHPLDGKNELHPDLAAMAVTSDHAARFTKAVRAAVGRLMRRRLFYGWLLVVLLPALTLAVCMQLELPLRWTLGVPLIILLISGLAWRWLVERPAVDGLGRRYEHVGVKGMREIAKATRATRHWKRWGPWAAVALVLAAGYLSAAHTRIRSTAQDMLYSRMPELRPTPPPPEPTPTEHMLNRYVVYNQDSPGIRSYWDPFVVKGDTLVMPDGRAADVSLRPQPGKRREWAALVRVLWRPTLDSSLELGTTERLQALPAFEKKYRVKCYVLVGVGGTPQNVAHLYMIPLDQKSPERLEPAALSAYEVELNGYATRFDRFKGRMGQQPQQRR